MNLIKLSKILGWYTSAEFASQHQSEDVELKMQKYLKMSEEEVRDFQLGNGAMDQFRSFLFSRVMPNLKKIGLLTDSVRPKYEALGILEYEHAPSDFEIDWAEITKPLESSDQVKAESDEMLAQIIKAQEAANN